MPALHSVLLNRHVHAELLQNAPAQAADTVVSTAAIMSEKPKREPRRRTKGENQAIRPCLDPPM